MPVEVRVPALGESIVEATVGSWLKQPGEVVEAGEALVQLETEKVNVDVAAERAGVLGEIRHPAGDAVRPGDILAVLDEESGARRESGVGNRESGGLEAEPTQAAPAAADRPHASPVARRMAEERGLELAQVTAMVADV